jgi:hypothetical protein
VIVKPDTLIGWHRKDFQRFWRCKSRPARRPLRGEIRDLIVRMAKENPTGARGEWRRRSISSGAFWCRLESSASTGPAEDTTTAAKGASSQRLGTFVRNHADAIVACVFMVAVTANFQLLYVLVILQFGSRRILQCNVTAHPSADGNCSNFGKDPPARPGIVSSSMIVIAFSRRISIRS